jgi:hypothetical protein
MYILELYLAFKFFSEFSSMGSRDRIVD